jgi:hypothetical protein
MVRRICALVSRFWRNWPEFRWFPKNKFRKVLLPEMESIIIGISRGGNSHQSETNL